MSKDLNSKIHRNLPWTLIVAGFIGLVASFALAVETVAYIRNPEQALSCSINPIVNCSSVIDTPQGEVLGFMNPLIGVVGFSVLIMFGVSLLYKAVYPKVLWWAAQVVSLAGLVLVHWFIYQSIYSLGSLCPYCMVVWLMTILIGLHIFIRNAKSGLFGVGSVLGRLGNLLSEYDFVVISIWYALIAALIISRFGLDSLLA